MTEATDRAALIAQAKRMSLYVQAPPLPSEPGTWWLDRDDDVWRVDAHGDLYPVSGDESWLPAESAPFRQLVLKA